MIQYLIDTDWVIHYLHGHTAIVEWLDELQPQGLVLSIVSLAELYEGVYYCCTNFLCVEGGGRDNHEGDGIDESSRRVVPFSSAGVLYSHQSTDVI
jgi:hypothetical protein